MYTVSLQTHTLTLTLTAAPYGAKQHQVSCLPWTMDTQVISYLCSLFHHQVIPSSLPSSSSGLFPSRVCPSTGQRGEASRRHLPLPGRPRHPAVPSLPLPEALFSFSLSLPCRPLLRWRGARQYLMGAIVPSCARLNGEHWLGVRTLRAEADRSVKDSRDRQLGGRWQGARRGGDWPPRPAGYQAPRCWCSSEGSPVTEAVSATWRQVMQARSSVYLNILNERIKPNSQTSKDNLLHLRTGCSRVNIINKNSKSDQTQRAI